jgi:DNA polymerase V
MSRQSYYFPAFAGFPSPAQGWDERPLQLEELLVAHPESIFFVGVRGTSMEAAGIADADVLVVDRALEAVDGRLVIAVLAGSLTVKRLIIDEAGHVWLQAEPLNRPAVRLAPGPFEIWGIVTATIRVFHPSIALKLLRR